MNKQQLFGFLLFAAVMHIKNDYICTNIGLMYLNLQMLYESRSLLNGLVERTVHLILMHIFPCSPV